MRPSALSDGSSCARFALATMIAPAAKLWPSALNDVFGRRHLHAGFLKRNETSVLSLLFSTTTVLPVPVMPPGAVTSFFTAVIGCLRMLLSVTSRDRDVAHQRERPARVVVRRRIGRREVLEREVHVGDRAVRLVAADDVVARVDLRRCPP